MIDSVIEWFKSNSGGIYTILGFILFLWLMNLRQKSLKKKALKEIVKKEVVIETFADPFGEQPMKVNTDDMLGQIKKLYEYTIKEIESKKQDYQNAKERYSDLLKVETKLRTQIPMLEEQKDILERQIQRIQEEQGESE